MIPKTRPIVDEDTEIVSDPRQPQATVSIGSANAPHLFRRVPATKSEVSQFLEHLRAASPRWPATPDRVGDLIIMLGEVLNNVVEHGAQAPSAKIDVILTMTSTNIQIVVIDEGRPLPETCLTRPKLPDREGSIQDLPEGGFGWFLIHSLAKEIHYERVEDRNYLLLKVSL